MQLTEFEKKVRNYKRTVFGERFVESSIAKVALPGDVQGKLSKFLESPKNFLVFCGNPGIGKTYFCSALMEWVMSKFNSYRYYHEKDILSKIRESMDKSGDYFKALSLYMDDEFIFLDDVGSQGVTEWRTEVIFDLIDNRYNSMKPTVITSNLSEDEIRNKYHERVASRIFASENTIIEIHNGSDLRRKGL